MTGTTDEYAERNPLLASPRTLNAEVNPEKQEGFGGKTIGFTGGLSLLVSNMTGPAMVSIPLVFQDAGWLTPILALVLVGALSTLSAVFLCEAMASLPGNENFEGRVEFSSLVDFYFGRTGHFIAQVFINMALQSTNIAAIIVSSQVMDSLFIALFKTTCGVSLYPKFGWECVHSVTDQASPFGNVYMLFSFGYLAVMLVVIPLGYLNLDDNVFVQVGATVFLGLVTLEFMFDYFEAGLEIKRVPMIGSDQSSVLGNILFNFAFVTTVPSWCNEKRQKVSVSKSLWIAAGCSTMVYFLLGYLGALAYTMPEGSNILSVINASPQSNIVTKILVYMFPIVLLSLSIPVFSIIVRYNLLHSKLCSKGVANLLAVVLPWLVVIPLMTGAGLSYVINYGGLVFSSVANFIIPFAIYVRAHDYQHHPRALTPHQTKIIARLHPKGTFDLVEHLKFSSQKYGDTESPHLSRSRPAYKAIPRELGLSSKIVALVSVAILILMIIAVITYDIIGAISS